LGYDDIEGYMGDESFQGAIVGRFGNRIGGGKFSIDGIEHRVTTNEGNNQLHGGPKGFNKVLWITSGITPNSVSLTYNSPDGEEGFPGNVDLTVTYTITDKNEFQIDYKGITDKPTLLNPTSHCYFNLTGCSDNTIINHELFIDADFITAVDKEMIPTGKLLKISGTPMDFAQPTPIGKNIDSEFEQIVLANGFDHNYVLNNTNGKVRKVASVYEPESGRKMEVLTNQAGLQFYSGNFLIYISKGKHNKPYAGRSGFCLEAQGFPDSPNKDNFPSVILRPGDIYKQTTIYRFSNE
jgi:aldose 1-epimerase